MCELLLFFFAVVAERNSELDGAAATKRLATSLRLCSRRTAVVKSQNGGSGIFIGNVRRNICAESDRWLSLIKVVEMIRSSARICKTSGEEPCNG